jgi:homoserine O-acetyltransferase
MQHFFYKQSFPLEAGGSLAELEIGYHTYGNLNSDGSNVVWICHALTASSAVADWWPGVVGEGCVINPQEHFIVCANIIGSCYGSSGPLSKDPATDAPYYNRFPAITIRDMVKAHILLRQHLGILQIHLLVGGSMGGYQALEWAIMESNIIQQLFLLTTSATESAWGIAVHTAQRMSIEADSSWQENSADAGSNGLKAARAIGMLTYRNYGIMTQAQSDTDSAKLDDYKASSYIRYQGDKLANRFNAYSYWLLTKALDTHHIARGRSTDVNTMLKSMTQRSLILGISSDILCPLAEQEQIAGAMPNATMVTIDSVYGHDGFLVEAEQISNTLRNWLQQYK